MSNRTLNRRRMGALLIAGVAGLRPAGAAARPLRPARAGSPGGERIRIGQIGTRHAHASSKMRSVRSLPDEYEVVGVAEPDPERAAEARLMPAYSGVPFISVEELLNSKGLKAIAVETGVRDLLKYAELSIRAGMHIHLDKPAGEDLAHYRRVLDEAARRRLTIQMGFIYRYNPAFTFTFEAVREGWLGQIFEIHGVISKKSADVLRRELAVFPGGTMFELGGHLIDAVVRILGRPEKVVPFTRRTFPEKDNLADNQLAVLEYPKTTVTLRSALIEYEGGRRRQFAVCGDEGVVDIKPLEPPQVRLALSRARGRFQSGYQDVPLPDVNRSKEEFIDLAKVIRGEKALEWSPEHDYIVQETLLRASGVL